MKKSKLFIFLTVLIILVPAISFASSCPAPYNTGLVPCGQLPSCPCGLSDLFEMILRIFNFLVLDIATPLAGLMIIIGGVLLIISGGGRPSIPGAPGSPTLANKGKDIIKWTVIGIVLIWSSYIIVDVVLKTIGYTGQWSILP
ncbi:MAG: hypothetical protein AAB877_02940 [Patescibacteria group bacterium]